MHEPPSFPCDFFRFRQVQTYLAREQIFQRLIALVPEVYEQVDVQLCLGVNDARDDVFDPACPVEPERSPGVAGQSGTWPVSYTHLPLPTKA